MERLLWRSHRLSNMSVSSQEILVPLRTLASSAQSIWCTRIWPEHCVSGSVLITGSFLSLLFSLLYYSCILQNPFLVRGMVKLFSGLTKARQALYWSFSLAISGYLGHSAAFPCRSMEHLFEEGV